MALEYKQFHKKWFSTATPVAGAKATGTLTFTGIPVAAETVTIGTEVYEFVAAAEDVSDPTYTPVILGATFTADNAVTQLALEISSNSPLFDAVANTTADTVLVVARKVGSEGNVASTTTCTNASWGAETLEGGAYATPVNCPAFIIISGVWYIADAPVTKYTVGGWKSATPA
jgi:hypothetical protein